MNIDLQLIHSKTSVTYSILDALQKFNTLA
jgi:hypothetical protein